MFPLQFFSKFLKDETSKVHIHLSAIQEYLSQNKAPPTSRSHYVLGFFLQGCGGRCLPWINEEKEIFLKIFQHFSYREWHWLATVLHFKFVLSLLVGYPPAKYSRCNIAALTFRDLILNAKMQDFLKFIFVVIRSKYWIKRKYRLRTAQLRKLTHNCFIKSRDLNMSPALLVGIKQKCHNSFTSVLHWICPQYFIVVCLFLERLDWEVEVPIHNES